MSVGEQALRFLQNLYGEHRGIACLAIGHGPHRAASGKYLHKDWREEFWAWPDQAGSLVRRALSAAGKADIYVSVLLRSERSRKAASALPSRWVWSDLDDAPRDEALLARLVERGGMVVDSGSPGHQQVYVRLAEDAPPGALSVLSKRMEIGVGGDHKHDAAVVLRLPGTLNHKGRILEDGEATPVLLATGDLNGDPGWSLEELDAALPALPSRPERPSGEGGEWRGTPSERLQRMVAEAPGEDRSAQTYALVSRAVEEGIPAPEIHRLAAEHAPSAEKYGDRLAGEVDRLLGKVESPPARSSDEEMPDETQPTLRIVPWHEFVDTHEPTAEALMGTPHQNVLPAGGLMLGYGGDGAAKTTLFVDLAHHLAAGEDWLGLPVPRRCRVLLLENEGSRGSFRLDGRARRDAWTGPPLGGWLFAAEEPWARFSFADPGLCDALAGWCRETEADVVIAGPLVELGAAGTGAPDEVSAFARLLADVRERLERPLAFVLAHHENTAGNISGAWGRLPETIIHVTSRAPGHTGVFWRKVRHSSDLHLRRWKLLWAEGRTFAHDETPDVSDEDIRAGVLDIVAANPGCSWRTLGDVCAAEDPPLPRERARTTLDALIDEGVVINRGGGRGGAGGGGFKLYINEDETVSGGSGHAPDTVSGLDRASGEEGSVSRVRSYRADTLPPAHGHADTPADDNWCTRCERVLEATHPGEPRCHCADPDRGAS